MTKLYRNLRNRRDVEEKGTPRQELTELYRLENIGAWLQYIFWAIVFANIIGLGIMVKVLAG